MKEFLIGAAGIVLAGAALAQTPVAQPQIAPAPQMPERIQTRDEVVAKVREHFVQLDANKDGFLTKDEAEAGRKVFKERIREKLGERREHRMQRHDPKVAFDRLDTNKDGVISRDEFTKGREQRIEKRIVMREKVKGAAKSGKLGEMRMHRMGGGMGGTRMIVMADGDHDGRITLAEAEAMALKHFDEMDANHDGQVTRDERGARHRVIIKDIRREVPDAG